MRARCRCGEVITVEESRGNDAEVIRCSGCGGPRTPGDDACAYCGDEFTLHEKDLYTVCPECMTRVSDRARFCHNCATPLRPEEEMGPATSAVCPSCAAENHLHSRALGTESISSLECDRCAGLWLAIGSFEELADKAVGTKVSVLRQKPEKTVLESQPKRNGPFYRRCAICRGLMSRSNYGMRSGPGGGSGVIVDICGEHGVWLDCRELEHILSWVRSGGAQQAVGRRRNVREAAAEHRQEIHGSRGESEKQGLGLKGRRLEDLLTSGRQTLRHIIGSLFDVS